ncbi:hypothetical protein AK812_SmicGene33107 [Symbiodinium microadriaticum]|uniref:Uncharacterized protein n=1 Tax=Symbiodinium microadriaticum TaxID=2951 RepID=A0A1Q9CSG1_SYMMI|nr:hypothetical protein AK812_SmicGene33107 [Symbiodinium microadriaticum]
MLGLKRQPTEEWATWNKRSLRRCRLALFHSGERDGPALSCPKFGPPSAISAGGDPIGREIFCWRSLAWWEEQKAAGVRIKHATRFNAFMDIDRQLSDTAGKAWADLARDRIAWASLESSFIAKYDVPWSSGKQDSLTNLAPNSSQSSDEQQPFEGPKVTGDSGFGTALGRRDALALGEKDIGKQINKTNSENTVKEGRRTPFTSLCYREVKVKEGGFADKSGEVKEGPELVDSPLPGHDSNDEPFGPTITPSLEGGIATPPPASARSPATPAEARRSDRSQKDQGEEEEEDEEAEETQTDDVTLFLLHTEAYYQFTKSNRAPKETATGTQSQVLTEERHLQNTPKAKICSFFEGSAGKAELLDRIRFVQPPRNQHHVPEVGPRVDGHRATKELPTMSRLQVPPPEFARVRATPEQDLRDPALPLPPPSRPLPRELDLDYLKHTPSRGTPQE